MVFVFMLMLLFYLPVITAIQAPVNMDNARKIPGVAFLLDNLPFVAQVIQGFLPSKLCCSNVADGKYM